MRADTSVEPEAERSGDRCARGRKIKMIKIKMIL